MGFKDFCLLAPHPDPRSVFGPKKKIRGGGTGRPVSSRVRDPKTLPDAHRPCPTPYARLLSGCPPKLLRSGPQNNLNFRWICARPRAGPSAAAWFCDDLCSKATVIGHQQWRGH